MSRRQNWTDEEIEHFLKLVQEKKILGLMDGKRLRTLEIFKSLETPMKDAGFTKDAIAMQNKFKNLKGEYYKCKRHNAISGNNRIYCKFFELLNELLENRPCVQQIGFDHNVQSQDIPTENVFNEAEIGLTESLEIAIEESATSPSGASTPCGSTPTPSTSFARESSPRETKKKRKTRYEKSLEEMISIQKGVRDDISQALTNLDSDNMMKVYLEKQEKILKKNTKYFLKGLENIFNKNKKRKRGGLNTSSSSSSSSSSESG